jgi:hypothetical protein
MTGVKKFQSSYPRGDGEWIAISYQANWANPGTWTAGRYRRVGNRVRVEMAPTRSTSTSTAGAACAILPAGYRPTAGLQLLAFNQNVGGTYSQNQIYIDTSGNIIVEKAVIVGGQIAVFAEFSID